ncbi:MAG: NAD(P)H-dependent oxidoreductase [Eubacteriaceae bacterium]|nr:NAD(P)H-dependent oxidoreductase [Eubacteriaceae bacterium]
MKKILMIVASFRKNSFNRQLAEAVGELFRGKAEVKILEYGDVPLFNQDMEFPTPEAVGRVREEVLSSDGIWIFSPEYNSKTPGVLKNLLDWLSRPVTETAGSRESAVRGKCVTVSSVAGKSAGAGVRKDLSELLSKMSMNVVYGEGCGIALGSDAFSTGKMDLSEEEINMFRAQAEELLRAAGQMI